MIVFRKIWGGFEGIWGCFAPWWSNWPMLKGQASLTHFQTSEILLGGPQRAMLWANKAQFGTVESPKMSYVGAKLHFDCGDHPDEAFWTKSGHLWPSEDLFRGQKARYRTYCGLRRALFACIMALWGPLQGLQRSGSRSVMPALLIWASWTIMWCLEPNLVSYKTSRGAKSVLEGSSRPPWPTQTPQNTLKTPPKPDNWPSLEPI